MDPQHVGRSLSCTELIPNAALLRLAEHCPIRATGRLSDTDTAAMAMNLPDLCGEMIALRVALKTPATTCSVSNLVLRQLAKDGPEQYKGVLTRRQHLILAARLSSMCRELITLRSLTKAWAA